MDGADVMVQLNCREWGMVVVVGGILKSFPCISTHEHTSGLCNASQLLLIARVKLEGSTGLQLSSEVPPSIARSLATGAKVGMVAHLSVLQEWVK